MQKEIKTISGHECLIYECGSSDTLLIQPVDDHDIEVLDSEVEEIVRLTGGTGFTCSGFPFTRTIDFVAGSGTTAHAVMKANAEDQGNRRFILIQKPEKVKSGSVAEKEGYSTIDEMGRERILRAAEELEKTSDGRFRAPGFRHYTLQTDHQRETQEIV